MASIVSGLGRLFHPPSTLAPSHTPRGQRQLESVTEEAHTYDLLYPEAGSLPSVQHHAFPMRHGDPSSIAAAATSSDDKGGLNIQHPRDIRFIVGQYIGGDSRVLFDTKPPPLSSTNRKSLDRSTSEQIAEELRRHETAPRSRTAPHTRQSSLSQAAQSIFGASGLPLSPVNETSGLFGGEQRRPNTSDGETAQAQLAREERYETDAMLSSMFGATGHRITTGTKIHIKPYTPSQPETSMPLSPGATRLAPQKRRTPLTRSTTAEDIHNLLSTWNSAPTTQQTLHRQSSSILITRIFYVDSADEDTKSAMGDGYVEPLDGSCSNIRDQGPKREFPILSDDQRSRKYRTPAFALAMVIYVPPHQPQARMPFSTRTSPALGQVTALGQPEASKQLSAEDFDHSVEFIMAHWDTITRALSSLEVIVRCQISGALSQLDVDTPAALNTSVNAPNSRPSRMRPPPLPALQLPVGDLQQSSILHRAIDMTSKRVASALQIRGVAVGQGRWGIWREEARGVGKWAGGREQNFFLFNLLTAFLGNHTEWLDLMSSRLRKAKQGRNRDHSHQHQYSIVRHRTVIVSLDKMAARRLIFLLSAFLATSSAGIKRTEAPRSEVSTSLPASSTSPLIGSPISRRISLRRTLSKNKLGYGWNGNSDDQPVSLDPDAATEVSDDRTITESPIIHGQDSHLQHARRLSDAASIRSVALPITAAGPRLRKASTTTTATILPESAIPVAHFASFLPEKRSSTTVDQRPSSSGSIASLALHRTLSRSDSVDHSGTSADSQSTGRWFWSSRRGSSTETSETPISSAEGLGILVPKELRAPPTADKLSRMVEDAGVAAGQNTPRAHLHRLEGETDSSGRTSLPKDIPREADILERFVFDLSVNESDGVIDVKLPVLDSQASSLGSMTSSQCAFRAAAGSFKEHLRPTSPTFSTASTLPQQRRSHTISEVGGWLRRYHQDLTLQAVQPYDTLKEEIKYAMRTEPPPTALLSQYGNNNADEWTDVCTSLIADITTFTLTRLTLRRKNACLGYHQADALLGRGIEDNPDEEFIEESLIDHDVTLTEAVEKILSHSGQSSHMTSRGPSHAASRPNSPSRSNQHSGDTTPALEIPKNECKRMVIGALEQVAKSVRDEMAQGSKSKDKDDNEAKDTLKEGVRRWFEEVETAER